MLSTRLTEALRIDHPVMLAGMGGVSYAALAAAVSNAGGLRLPRRVHDVRAAHGRRDRRDARGHRQAVRRRPPDGDARRPRPLGRARDRGRRERLRRRPRRALQGGRPLPRARPPRRLDVREGRPRPTRRRRRVRPRGRPGNRGGRAHRHRGDVPARPDDRRRGRRARSRSSRRAACSTGAGSPRRSRSVRTGCGWARGSSRRQRRGASRASRTGSSRRRRTARPCRGRSRARPCASSRTTRRRTTSRTPTALQPFPDQLGVSFRDGTFHLGGDETTPGVDPDKEGYPAGQAVGAIEALVPAAELLGVDGRRGRGGARAGSSALAGR